MHRWSEHPDHRNEGQDWCEHEQPLCRPQPDVVDQELCGDWTKAQTSPDAEAEQRNRLTSTMHRCEVDRPRQPGGKHACLTDALQCPCHIQHRIVLRDEEERSTERNKAKPNGIDKSRTPAIDAEPRTETGQQGRDGKDGNRPANDHIRASQFALDQRRHDRITGSKRQETTQSGEDQTSESDSPGRAQVEQLHATTIGGRTFRFDQHPRNGYTARRCARCRSRTKGLSAAWFPPAAMGSWRPRPHFRSSFLSASFPAKGIALAYALLARRRQRQDHRTGARCRTTLRKGAR